MKELVLMIAIAAVMLTVLVTAVHPIEPIEPTVKVVAKKVHYPGSTPYPVENIIPWDEGVYPERENCAVMKPERPVLDCAEQVLMCTCKDQGTNCNWNWICIQPQ